MTTIVPEPRDRPASIAVLHVDDEPDLADVAGTYLERHDDRLSVDTATDAEEGLDQLARGDFDCVVSDYDMPGRNGIEFLEAIREDYPDLPFVLYTGKGSEEVASEAISAGVTDYLQKESGTGQYAVLANRIVNAVEQYRSRRAVEETERKLTELADKTDDVLFVVEADWSEFHFVNEGYEDLWGAPLDELADDAEAFLEYVHPEDRQAVVRSMERIANGTPDELEYRIVRPGGETRWVRAESKPIFREDGSVARIVGFVRDVTDRTERERELQRKERRYQAVFNDPNILVGLIDTDGTVLDINETAMEYVAASLDSIRGEPFPETPWFDHSESLQAEVETWIERAASGEYVEFEADISGQDRDQHVIEGVFRPVTNDEGEVVSLLISDRDVTERRERERELRRQNDRLDEFASVVSHDLRNPLNVAEGRLELAGQECDSEHLAAVSRAHDRMNELVDGLLALAREGEGVGSREPIDVAGFTERCWHHVDPADATLRTDVDRRIRADRSRLRQLLENLLRNAIDHGPTGVTVTVGELAEGFYVEDDGPGILESEREDVFDTGYSTKEGGTGVGLRIVEDVVDGHGWDVRVTDGAEGGTRFEVTGVAFEE